ncbi:SCO7613 C-terminal domain-containing membrane protein, partial [Streptomyces sp. NPDC055078]
MRNVPPPLPPAEELVILHRELSRLDARRAQLLARRAWLLAALQPGAVRPPHAHAATPPHAHAATPPQGPHRAGPGAEASSPSVQNLLLALGGVLLAIAAIAFTLVSWGDMGIGGRSAVLGTLTLAALGTPVVLLRRGLTSTAESVAALAIVLMALDAYALHRVALSGTDGVLYAAWATGVLAALWTAYGLALDKLRIPLRIPLPVALVTAQLPPALWSASGTAAAPPLEWALLATAAFDVVVAVRATSLGIRVIATAGASVTGGCALLAGGFRSLVAESPSGALEPAALLAAGAG